MRHNVLYISAVPFFKGGAEFALMSFLQNPMVNARLIVPSDGELADRVRKLGIHVDVVDYGAVLNIRRPFKIIQGFTALSAAVKAAIKIHRIAQEHKAICIHSNGLKVHAIACLSNLCGAGNVVCHIHDIPYTKQEVMYWKLLRVLATRIVLVSRHCWPGRSIPKNAVVIHNCIAVEDRILSETICAEPINIGFIGRIHPHKGLHILIQWLNYAKIQGENFLLHIRGEAAPDQEEYLRSVKETIKECGLSKRCIFQGRISAYEEIYDNMDIIVMPSIMAEPFGLVAIEAYERGIPCIAYPSGALPDIIKHEKTGMLCSSDEEFFSALARLSTDPVFYRSIRVAAFEDVKNNYSLPTLYSKLNHLYSSLK